MKKILSGLLLLTHLLAWPLPADARQKVALLLEHEQSSPWIELLKEGLLQAQKDFNIEGKIIIAPSGENQTEIFRNAASSCDLALVTGESLHNVLRDNAGSFRRVMFGSIDAGIRASNIMSVTFSDQEAAFLAGAAAAILTKKPGVKGINGEKVIGWLSGRDTPAMRTLYNGFQEGAKLIDPDIKIAQAVVGSFTDATVAAQKAASLLLAGADVIALAAGAGNPAALSELEKYSAWHIDLDSGGKSANALGIIRKDAARAVYEIIKSFAQKKFQAKEILTYDLENNGVAYENNLANNKTFAEITRRINELRSELMKGSIRIKSLRQRTLCDCLD